MVYIIVLLSIDPIFDVTFALLLMFIIYVVCPTTVTFTMNFSPVQDVFQFEQLGNPVSIYAHTIIMDLRYNHGRSLVENALHHDYHINNISINWNRIQLSYWKLHSQATQQHSKVEENCSKLKDSRASKNMQRSRVTHLKKEVEKLINEREPLISLEVMPQVVTFDALREALLED